MIETTETGEKFDWKHRWFSNRLMDPFCGVWSPVLFALLFHFFDYRPHSSWVSTNHWLIHQSVPHIYSAKTVSINESGHLCRLPNPFPSLHSLNHTNLPNHAYTPSTFPWVSWRETHLETVVLPDVPVEYRAFLQVSLKPILGSQTNRLANYDNSYLVAHPTNRKWLSSSHL